LRFDPADKSGIAGVYSNARVVTHAVSGGEVTIEAEMPERLIERYRAHLMDGARKRKPR
jgi:hypothetical protein